ncbi:MAG: trigger factor family protein, partial [Coriobacteriales bacterium]|nr:trigger factor family protein [Coriobacteriales bacterium]
MKKDIKVDMTELENNQVMLDVTVDKEDVKGYVDFAYKVAAQQYRIPGFRPGKAPRKVLDNALGKRVIFAQATDALLNETYPMAVETQALVVLGDPNIQTDELVKLDYDYTYHVELNVKPKLELTSYDPVEVEMPPMEPTEKEVMGQ